MGFWLSRAGLTIALVAGVVRPVRAPVFEELDLFAQVAVFLPKIEYGSRYAPPACPAIFSDVARPSQFACWIEQLYEEHITAGCAGPP
jgi:hypothetical protein